MDANRGHRGVRQRLHLQGDHGRGEDGEPPGLRDEAGRASDPEPDRAPDHAEAENRRLKERVEAAEIATEFAVEATKLAESRLSKAQELPEKWRNEIPKKITSDFKDGVYYGVLGCADELEKALRGER